MPYIDQKSRQVLNPLIDPLVRELRLRGFVPGEMNYVLTRIADAALGTHVNYDRINDVVGWFECAKLELYRRRAAPYEDTKIQLNGDVYAAEL